MLYEVAEKVFELKEKGNDVISLNLGETNLPVPECAIEAAIETVKNRNAGYSSAAGLTELREKIAERENCQVENIVIGPGSKHLIRGLMTVLGEREKKVIIPSPNWPTYASDAEQIGLKTEIIKTSLEKKWLFNSIQFEDANMLILCNPLNPTSTVYPKRLMKETIKEAQENGVNVVIDEAYKSLAFNKIEAYDGAVRTRSFSKEFNMEGFRLGYIITTPEIVKKIIEFNQYTITCVPEFVQKAGLACLENEKEILAENRAIWKKRMPLASKMFKEAGFKFAEPESGIYVFATHENIQDGAKFTWDLLEKGVGIAPGIAFGDYNNFLRVSINQSEELLEKAMEKIASLL